MKPAGGYRALLDYAVRPGFRERGLGDPHFDLPNDTLQRLLPITGICTIRDLHHRHLHLELENGGTRRPLVVRQQGIARGDNDSGRALGVKASARLHLLADNRDGL